MRHPALQRHGNEHGTPRTAGRTGDDGRAGGTRGTERLTIVYSESEQSPRDRVAKLLRDPKSYFDDARQWAGRKAKADVQRKLSERQARRERRGPLLRRLGLAGR
ncbi:MAG: hypothetical protein WCA46_22205 [Actinocatenispora sp.]